MGVSIAPTVNTWYGLVKEAGKYKLFTRQMLFPRMFLSLEYVAAQAMTISRSYQKRVTKY
jgi:hypothetical protein